MKNNEIYNVVKINNLALDAITPKVLDALLELDEKCELDVESLTLNIRIKCQDVQITSKYYDDCYDNREYISTKILFNNKTEIVLERDMYTSIMIIYESIMYKIRPPTKEIKYGIVFNNNDTNIINILDFILKRRLIICQTFLKNLTRAREQ